MVRATDVFGRRATRWLLRPVCWYFVAFAPERRRVSRAFLRRALGREPTLGDLVRHFHAFAATTHDRVALLRDRHEQFDIELHGRDALERALDSGRGCILLGSHLGSFEVLRALGRVADVRNVSIVMYERGAAHTARALSRVAPQLHDRIIAPGRPDTMLKVKERLERGEIVGMLSDRTFRGARARRCSFLGAPASFPLGPLLVAAALGAPVVTFFGLYMGGSRYEVWLETLADGGDVPRAERVRRAADWLETFVARLERHARRAPYNWFNFYDFWREEAR